MVSDIFHFHPWLGKIPILTIIFQGDWNHQLVLISTLVIRQSIVSCFFLTRFFFLHTFFPNGKTKHHKVRTNQKSWRTETSMGTHVNPSFVAVITHMDASKNSGTPKSSILIGVFHYKPSILGYPYFRKHPSLGGPFKPFIFPWVLDGFGVQRLVSTSPKLIPKFPEFTELGAVPFGSWSSSVLFSVPEMEWE